jgi:bifunctional non-homologous end joining protein LigD
VAKTSGFGFIKPMLLLKTEHLPDDPKRLIYQLKLDGYRAVAFKAGGKVHLRSRNNNDFASRYPDIAEALKHLPDNTVIDGEIVAFDEDGRPSFNTLQNHGSSGVPLVYFVFDVMVLRGKDVMGRPLEERLTLLVSKVLSKLYEPIRPTVRLDAPLPALIESVEQGGLEGLVAKRRHSLYEPGLRSGAWLKMRVSQGQEFVIGGYTIGGRTFDALVFGYYEGKKLRYVSRTRNGFTPRVREELMAKFRKLVTDECPFANLPELHAGRWGVGLTAAKMRDCRWLKPKLVGQFEFVEWTSDNHLRHSRFMGLREDKRPVEVIREGQ